MRIESSVTTISWIPSEAVAGMTKMPFEIGIAHYDDPPPDALGDLEVLRAADRFRFANELRAWIDVHDGRIADAGYAAGGRMGATTMQLGRRRATFAATPLPDIQIEPEMGDSSVRFVQTAGGRTGVPAPRRVHGAPLVQWHAPLAWTTLALTLHVDGRVEHEVVGASPFPRFWVYDHAGDVVAKSGLIDFKDWYRHAFEKHSPWGESDSQPFVTAMETALERELSLTIMRGGEEPKVRKFRAGSTLTEEGEQGDELYLLLDGVLAVVVDGEQVAEVGPGAILGERALLEGGARTSTLRAVTRCKVAIATAKQLDRLALEEVSTGHRRENER